MRTEKNNIYKNLSELWTLTRIYLTMKSNKKKQQPTAPVAAKKYTQ